MTRPIFLCYAARSPLHVPFSLYSHSFKLGTLHYSHSFKLGTLHCSLIGDIYQTDHKYVTVFTSEV